MTSNTTLTKAPFLQSPEFEQNLDRLAEVAVHIGLGLGPGQEMVMTAALDAIPLARRITEQAYKAGASLVTALFADEQSALLRFRYGSDASFDAAPSWLYEGMAQAYRNGAARLAIAGSDPSLLSKRESGKGEPGESRDLESISPGAGIDRAPRNQLVHRGLRHSRVGGGSFPDLPADEALARLWDAIFTASRADQPDPVAAWKEHDANLHARADRLNEKRYSALHFRGPGTDFRVGLADDHLWLGGGTTAAKWPVLHSQHTHRGSLHDAAQGSHRRASDQHQAAILFRDDDRRDLRAIRRREDCGGPCVAWQ